MNEQWRAEYRRGRDRLRRLCERTIDLEAGGFGWVCTFSPAEAHAVVGWLALSGRGCYELHPVADKVAASFTGIVEGGDVLVVDRYVEAAVFLLDEVADSYPEHALMVGLVAELLFTRLYSETCSY